MLFVTIPLKPNKQKKPKPEQKTLLLLVIHEKISAAPKVTEEVNSFKINTVRQNL